MLYVSGQICHGRLIIFQPGATRCWHWRLAWCFFCMCLGLLTVGSSQVQSQNWKQQQIMNQIMKQIMKQIMFGTECCFFLARCWEGVQFFWLGYAFFFGEHDGDGGVWACWRWVPHRSKVKTGNSNKSWNKSWNKSCLEQNVFFLWQDVGKESSFFDWSMHFFLWAWWWWWGLGLLTVGSSQVQTQKWKELQLATNHVWNRMFFFFVARCWERVQFFWLGYAFFLSLTVTVGFGLVDGWFLTGPNSKLERDAAINKSCLEQNAGFFSWQDVGKESIFFTGLCIFFWWGRRWDPTDNLCVFFGFLWACWRWVPHRSQNQNWEETIFLRTERSTVPWISSYSTFNFYNQEDNSDSVTTASSFRLTNSPPVTVSRTHWWRRRWRRTRTNPGRLEGGNQSGVATTSEGASSQLHRPVWRTGFCKKKWGSFWFQVGSAVCRCVVTSCEQRVVKSHSCNRVVSKWCAGVLACTKNK